MYIDVLELRIWKERSGTTLVCKLMRVYMHSNIFVIVLEHIVWKAFFYINITLGFLFYGVRDEARQGYSFLMFS